MKANIRRLRRLEDRFGTAIETESSRRLQERIKAGRRRVAEMRESLEGCRHLKTGRPLLRTGIFRSSQGCIAGLTE
jgi:Mg-chelatase subunit ChlI